MSFVCLWSPAWPPGEAPPPALAEALLEVVPRLALDGRGVLWADGRGLPQPATAERLLARAEGRRADAYGVDGETSEAGASREGGAGAPVHAGVAAVPIVAEVAARRGARMEARAAGAPPRAGGAAAAAAAGAPSRERVTPVTRVTLVPAGGERAFLEGAPLGLLGPDPRLQPLLEGIGVGTCGQLAALPLESVEVRLGPQGAALWRLACADDPRRIFGPIAPERPHAGMDFIDYVVSDPARLVFTANALLGGVTDGLRGRGEHARRIALTLPLANGRVWRRVIRPARPTASREVWLRLIRSVLERLTVPDAVAGMQLVVEAAEPAATRQGDLFDRGFASAAAVEAAVSRLLEEQGEVVVTPENTSHPLLERRTRWRPREPTEVADGAARAPARRGAAPATSREPAAAPAAASEACSTIASEGASASLTLQLLAEPRPIQVEALARRDHWIPVRVRGPGGWRAITTAAGPDRISGGQWEARAFAREYFRCVSEDGLLLWLFRDGREGGGNGGSWFLHGWWD